MFSRRFLAGVMLMTAVCADARAAAAQTADDLFDDQAVQRIDLYVNTRDWYWLKARFAANDYYPANMKWNGTTVTNVALRVRGAGSRSDAKPALRVDFNRYATGRTFLGLTSMALNNGAQDASGLRELLTMKTYRALGLPAPRMAPVALYVNNAYLGLYNAVEEVDEAFLTRAFGESAGHLFEYRWSDFYHFEYLGSTLEPYAALYEPKTRVTESMGALYLPVEAHDPRHERRLRRQLRRGRVGLHESPGFHAPGRGAGRHRRGRRPARELGPLEPLPLPPEPEHPAPIHPVGRVEFAARPRLSPPRRARGKRADAPGAQRSPP